MTKLGLLTGLTTVLVAASGVLLSDSLFDSVNTAPVMAALSPASGNQGTSIAISGSCTDDNLPTPVAITYQWTKTAGPGTCSFPGGSTSASTTVNCDTVGSVTLTLVCCDYGAAASCAAPGKSDTDTLALTINTASTLPIDQLVAAGNTLPAFCASTSHRLRSAYAGSAFRIQRSSDSAQVDVGFTTDLTTQATITSHCSGTTCGIVTLYDQCGSARDVTNATFAEMPVIYTASTLQMIGGLPAPIFNAGAGTDNTGDGWSRGDSIGITGTSAVSIWAFASTTNTTSTRTIVQIGTGLGGGSYRFGHLVSTGFGVNNANNAGATAYRAFTLPTAVGTASDYLTTSAAASNFNAATLYQRGSVATELVVAAGTYNLASTEFSIGANATRARGHTGSINTVIVMGYVPSSGGRTVLNDFGAALRTLGGV